MEPIDHPSYRAFFSLRRKRDEKLFTRQPRALFAERKNENEYEPTISSVYRSLGSATISLGVTNILRRVC